jgi:transposase-like protein
LFTDITEYMTRSREERRAHLRLEEPCIKIGGGNSSHFRGLLAHHLRTTIPDGHSGYVCHACNQHGCSNPSHLYWGTPRDNYLDAIANGELTVAERMRRKYTTEELKAIYARGARAGGLKGGGTKHSLPEERVAQIKAAIAEVPVRHGRIAIIARRLGVSHTQVRKYMRRLGIE